MRVVKLIFRVFGSFDKFLNGTKLKSQIKDPKVNTCTQCKLALKKNLCIHTIYMLCIPYIRVVVIRFHFNHFKYNECTRSAEPLPQV